MSRRTFSIPLRFTTQLRSSSPGWICRRCLVTEAVAASTAVDAPPPQSAPIPESQSTSTITGATTSLPYDPTLPQAKRIDPATGRAYSLAATDVYLKRHLPQRIPEQYLQHSTAPHLHELEREQRAKTKPHKRIVGVVVSAGKMDKTVKVRVPGQRWEKKIKKYYKDYTNHLVHDPNNSLVAGDVVELHRLRVSKDVHHVVASIVTPFGRPVSERPPIPTPDDRLAAYKKKRFAKLERRRLRQGAARGLQPCIEKLKEMGLDPGDVVEPGKSETANLRPNTGDTGDNGNVASRNEVGRISSKGGLSGRKGEANKINARAKRNKESAMKLGEKAEENKIAAAEKTGNLG